MDGIDVLRGVKAGHPGLKVIVLTMHAGREYVARAMKGGADAYLLKDSAVQDLVAAVHAVVAGQSYFSPTIQQQMAGLLRGDDSAPSARVQPLTDREREVLQLAGARPVEQGSGTDAEHQRAHGGDASRQPDAQAGREVGGAADSGGDSRGDDRAADGSVVLRIALRYCCELSRAHRST